MMMCDNGSLLFYRSILPSIAGEFIDELDDCVRSLVAQEKNTDASLFKLVLFSVPDDEINYSVRLRLLETTLLKYFPNKCPTFSMVCQVPETPGRLSVEAAFIRNGYGQIHYRRCNNQYYAVIEWPDYKELWASGLEGSIKLPSYEDRVIDSFNEMQKVLEAEGMNFNHIVRQWNYIGGILQNSNINATSIQNYQTFNEVRHSFYQRFRTVKGFPAATGIGHKHDNVSFEICAIQSEKGPRDFAIENPKQINPYNYGQQVLVGNPIHSQVVKHPPEFERAKLVMTPCDVRLYISGTASITGQKTIGTGDVEKQTLCTIDNIRSLTAHENLIRSYPQLPDGKFIFSVLRVYIKDSQYMDQVKQICRSHFPSTPITFVLCDICRDELLVEIEGEMHFVARKALSL